VYIIHYFKTQKNILVYIDFQWIFLNHLYGKYYTKRNAYKILDDCVKCLNKRFDILNVYSMFAINNRFIYYNIQFKNVKYFFYK